MLQSSSRRSVVTLSCLLLACGPATPTQRPFPMELARGVEALEPPANLVGTGSPGDVYTITVNGRTFILRNDRGTPAIRTDDFIVTGDVTARNGAAPFEFIARAVSGTTAFSPGERFSALAMPGLGYAINVGGVIVTAVEPAPCAETLMRYRTLLSNRFSVADVAAGTYFESLRPSRMLGSASSPPDGGGLFRFGDPSDASTNWEFVFASCRDMNTWSGVAVVSNPFSRAVATGTARYRYNTVSPVEVMVHFTHSGAYFVDFGYGFGSVLAMPDELSDTTPSLRQMQLELRLRSRTLVGWVSNTSMFQPVGATREDPTISRRVQRRLFAVTLDVNGQDGRLQLRNPDGTAVGARIPVLVTQQGAALSLRTGLTEVTGVTIDNKTGSSFVLSGLDVASASAAPQAPTEFETAVSIAPNAGEELFRRTFVWHLRTSTPNDCFGPSVTLPPEFTQSRGTEVPVVAGDAVTLSLRFDGTSVRASAIDRGATPVSSTALPATTRYVAVPRYLPVELSATADRRVRLLCGPEYPWQPGNDVFAAVEGAQTNAVGNLGFVVPGVYIIESGPTGAQPGAQSQYFVIEVRPGG